MSSGTSKNDNLEKAAKFIVTYIASLAPEYGDRLQIVKDERGFTDLQTLGSIVCASLDKGDHMLVPTHPLFQGGEPAHGTGETVTCKCGNTYITLYPAQPFCGNSCPALKEAYKV